MVQRLSDSGIVDPVVLRAFSEVPRHLFVEEALRGKAYGTHSLPIGFQQTISQPEIAAKMTELLEVKSTHRVLEVGTGSGYQAAILSLLASQVVTIERIPQLARRAREVLAELKMTNVTLKVSDGSQGLGESDLFDGILVAAAAPALPEPLLHHLARGGRLVIPIGDDRKQTLFRITREGDEFVREDCGPCKFVNLVGRSGWATPQPSS